MYAVGLMSLQTPRTPLGVCAETDRTRRYNAMNTIENLALRIETNCYDIC